MFNNTHFTTRQENEFNRIIEAIIERTQDSYYDSEPTGLKCYFKTCWIDGERLYVQEESASLMTGDRYYFVNPLFRMFTTGKQIIFKNNPQCKSQSHS